MTLAEVMCASFLLVALITMCASALHPAAKVIWRMRRVLEAQIVADSVVESVRAEVEEAREYVKMDPYDGDGGAELPHADGSVTFINNDGYIVCISTGGTEAAEAGRLLYCYCAEDSGGGFREEGRPETSMETAVFPEEFYTGLYVGLRFLPVFEDGLLMHVKITAQVGTSVENAGAGPVVRDVLCTESVIADLRYATVLEDGVRVKVGLPLNPAGADLQEKEGGHGANCPGAAA